MSQDNQVSYKSFQEISFPEDTKLIVSFEGEEGSIRSSSILEVFPVSDNIAKELFDWITQSKISPIEL